MLSLLMFVSLGVPPARAAQAAGHGRNSRAASVDPEPPGASPGLAPFTAAPPTTVRISGLPEDFCTKDRNLPTSHTEDHAYEADPHLHHRSEAYAPLSRLRELAFNLNWSWNHDTIELFRRLDGDLWEISGHNPVLMLGRIEQQRLEEAEADDSYLAHLERVCRSFDDNISDKSSWFSHAYGARERSLIAYYSAEFGER